MFYETFICFFVSETKPLCFSLCSQMFADVERCWIYNIQNVCHANEQLPLCYFFSINVLENIVLSFSQNLKDLKIFKMFSEHWLSRPQVEQLMTWFVILGKSSKIVQLLSNLLLTWWSKNESGWLYNFYADQPFLRMVELMFPRIDKISWAEIIFFWYIVDLRSYSAQFQLCILNIFHQKQLFRRSYWSDELD